MKHNLGWTQKEGALPYVSAESGIPDFRSKNGLYHGKNKKFSVYKPEYLLSHDCPMHKSVFF